MKTLIVLFALMGFTFNSNDVTLDPETVTQIKKEVASEYQVQNEDVTLQSPNLVYVDLGLIVKTGVASFTPCGEDCTEIDIDFGDNSLQVIIEDELEGF